MVESQQRKIFSNNLRRIMENSGKTQADMVRQFGISRATASSWCNGSKMPRLGKIEEICKWLDVSKYELLKSKVITTGDRLSALINNRKETVSTISEKTGISVEDLEKYLNSDKGAIPDNVIKVLAKSLGTNVRYLLGNDLIQLEAEDNGMNSALAALRDMTDDDLAGIKEPAAPKGSGPELPPGYEKLTPENKELIDKMIATLSKSQSGQ